MANAFATELLEGDLSILLLTGPGDMKEAERMATDRIESLIKEQLAQALETYRVQVTLLVQIGLGFITADVAAVGFALSTRNAAVLLVACVFPLSILSLMRSIGRRMVPIAYTAVALESRYTAQHAWLMTTYLEVMQSTSYADQMVQIASLHDRREVADQLREMSAPLGNDGRKWKYLLWSVSILQAVGATMSILLWHWRFM